MMRRSFPLIAAGVLGSIALLALSAWLRSWGGVALVLLGAAGLAWYRAQVARTEETEQFFGDMGEETRLTGFQGAGSPSELPLERTVSDAPPPSARP